MVHIYIFGQAKLIKKNPWLSGKLRRAVEAGLAKPKKDIILAQPPPWFFDINALSNAQLAQNLRLSRASIATAGKPVTERLRVIKREASGPTGLPRKERVRAVKIGKIITIAQARGISIPAELRGLMPAVTVPAAPAAPARITE